MSCWANEGIYFAGKGHGKDIYTFFDQCLNFHYLILNL